MEEYCNYCQNEVDAWDEGDGVWSCPSCLNILFTSSLDDDGEQTIEAVDQSTYNTYTADTGKDMWGETNPRLGQPDILRGGRNNTHLYIVVVKHR